MSAEAQKTKRDKLVREGGRQIAVFLTPAANAKLSAWLARGESIAGIVNRLLTRSKP